MTRRVLLFAVITLCLVKSKTGVVFGFFFVYWEGGLDFGAFFSGKLGMSKERRGVM